MFRMYVCFAHSGKELRAGLFKAQLTQPRIRENFAILLFLNLNNLKTAQYISSERRFYAGKLMLWLTFDPVFVLTGFPTTRP